MYSNVLPWKSRQMLELQTAGVCKQHRYPFVANGSIAHRCINIHRLERPTASWMTDIFPVPVLMGQPRSCLQIGPVRKIGFFLWAHRQHNEADLLLLNIASISGHGHRFLCFLRFPNLSSTYLAQSNQSKACETERWVGSWGGER